MNLIETDLRSNFLVEASAGTGKTYSLVARLVAGIVAGIYTVEHIAAVTFTRKAAAELSSRLRLGLERRGSEPRAAAALERFPDMFVGTVHSFCGRILRQCPVEAGMPPNFQEIEEHDDHALQARTLRAQLESLQGRKVLRSLADFGAGVADLIPPLRAICDRGGLDYPRTRSRAPDLDADWQQVQMLYLQLRGLLPETSESEPTCKLLALGRALEHETGLSDRDNAKDLMKLLGNWEAEPKVVKRYWGANRRQQDQALEPARQLVEQFRTDFVLPRLSAWRSHLYAECMPFLLQVRTAALEERRLQGLANYNDLLCRCQRLLREHPAVLDRLRKRFRHLFVDEFQDTDPVQAELFVLLASDEPADCEWKQHRLRPSSLFLVGDPKQSIYRFRDADIETYKLVRDLMVRAGGKVLPLTVSHRSNARICEWTNRVFSQLLPTVSNLQQAGFSPLHARGSQDPRSASVTTLTLSCQRASEVSGEEAGRIAAWIATQGPPYSRYLILTSRKAEMATYHRALVRQDVPCQANQEPQSIGPVGRILLQVLSVLSNGFDAIALVGVLRGRCFGHSDRELFLHVQERGHLRLESTADAAPGVASSLAMLAKLRGQVRWLPLGAAARLVYSQLGLDCVAGDLSLENLSDALAERGEEGLTLAQAVAELSAEDSRVPVPVDSPGRDVVRVMNVHTAKGLEAAVVFLAAPTLGLPIQVDHAVDERGQGFLCMRRHRKLLAHPAHWADVEEREREFLEAERVRLLYVAATRARERLIVSRWTGPQGAAPRPWSLLEPFLDGCQEFDHCDAVPKQNTEPLLSLEEVLLAQETQQARRAACKLASWRRHTVSASNVARGFIPTLPADPTQGEGREWGDLIHRLMQQVVRRPELERGELGLMARWFALDRPELAPYLEGALDQVERVRQSSFWKHVLAARERLAEVPFGQRSDEALIFGVIDLVLSQPDGWDIVDYKTDRKRMDELLAAYAPQLAQYAKSWSDIAREQVRSTALYGLREGQLGQVSLD